MLVMKSFENEEKYKESILLKVHLPKITTIFYGGYFPLVFS